MSFFSLFVLLVSVCDICICWWVSAVICRGPKTACILFFILHLLMCFLKSISGHPSIWVMSICLALASSVFSFCFETWMIVEHEKVCVGIMHSVLNGMLLEVPWSDIYLDNLQQGHRQDMLNDTLWLMFFFESTSLVGSQAFANMAVKDADRSFLTLPKSASFLAILSILYINKKWNGCEQLTSIGNYTKSLSSLILNGRNSMFKQENLLDYVVQFEIFSLMHANSFGCFHRAVIFSWCYYLIQIIQTLNCKVYAYFSVLSCC